MVSNKSTQGACFNEVLKKKEIEMKVNKVIILSLLCGMGLRLEAVESAPSQNALYLKIKNHINTACGLEKIQKQVDQAASPFAKKLWGYLQNMLAQDPRRQANLLQEIHQNYSQVFSSELLRDIDSYYVAKSTMQGIWDQVEVAYSVGGKRAALDWLQKASQNPQYAFYLNKQEDFKKDLVNYTVLSDTLFLLNRRVNDQFRKMSKAVSQATSPILMQVGSVVREKGVTAGITYLESNSSKFPSQLLKDLKELLMIESLGLSAVN